MYRYELLPEELRGGMQRYIEDRIEPGSFLRSVLENDLRGACANADHENRYRLFDVMSWIYNEAPGNCWGSVEHVARWLSARAS